MITIVVVAGDDHIVRALAEFVKTVLSEVSRDEARVLPAASADEVLSILGREPIDLLMTDDRLPDMTGLELVRWLRPGLVGAVKWRPLKGRRLDERPPSLPAQRVEVIEVGSPLDAEPLPEPEGQVIYRAGMTMADVERAAIEAALKETRGNRRKAAEVLGIGERTLYRKLKEYQLA